MKRFIARSPSVLWGRNILKFLVGEPLLFVAEYVIVIEIYVCRF